MFHDILNFMTSKSYLDQHGFPMFKVGVLIRLKLVLPKKPIIIQAKPT